MSTKFLKEFKKFFAGPGYRKNPAKSTSKQGLRAGLKKGRPKCVKLLIENIAKNVKAAKMLCS